ncbi:HAD-IA family hydrolase [Mycoplasmatota bacterium]|nr:HAD-IA family hydrolase [Mycoplasmatota bacterium]
MKLILFDLDGTLIQSTDIILSVFEQMIHKYFPKVELEQKTLTSFLGQTLQQTFGMYTSDDHLIEDIIKDYRIETEKALHQGLESYPHAKETIEYFRSKNILVGIVTSKMNQVALSHLKLVGLDHLIDHLVGHDDVKNHKPHAEPIEKALAYFDVKPEDAIYVGDHENDIKSAHHANVLSCAVTYSNRLSEMLMEKPTYVIDDLENLKDLI